MPLVSDAMNRAQEETGQAKLFSANITADDHKEMIARGDFVLEYVRPDPTLLARWPSWSTASWAAPACHHRPPPVPGHQYLHYHRAGHGAVTSPSRQAWLRPPVLLAKMSRLQGASGIHVGTMGYGKMEGDGKDNRASPT